MTSLWNVKKGSLVNLLFFDLNDEQSFLKLQDWMGLIKEHGEPNCLNYLIGNIKVFPD